MSLKCLRRGVVVFSLALGIMLIISSCAPAATPTSEEEEGKYGEVLKVAIQADVVGLDPHLEGSYSSFLVIEQVYEGLMHFTPEMDIEPLLAESYEVTDPLTYEFKLRQGIKFHNGREMTSADVKYSLDRIRDPDGGSPRSQYLTAIESVETPDDYTVIIHLSEPFAPLLSYLANAGFDVVPQEVVEEHGDLVRTMVGTGPFMFVEQIPNTRTVVERNPNYWRDGRPYLDGIEFIPMPEDRGRTDNIVTGNVDYADQIPQKDIDILEDNPDIRLEGGLSSLHDFLFFNLRNPPFDDLKVRQAIAWALDREAMTETILYGHGQAITCGKIWPYSWAYHDCNYYSGQDLAKAQQLLSESGYAGGFSVVLKCGAPYKAQIDAGQMVKEWLQPLGIEVEVVPVEWSTYIDDLMNHNFDMAIVGWMGMTDPDEWVFNHYHSEGQWNLWGYSNPTVDELLEEARTLVTPEERKPLYDEVQEIIAEEVPVAYFFWYEQYEAVADYVNGYEHMPNQTKITFVDTWLDK
ncbi:MAG: peptide ABC transporter substrate-binding protein [Anaerolineae bacterium]|nr:peptide ABC transporter substrate-binding protein [Anaerolineae bacterium]NIN99957.1 peptide ABC transporter substrate-binding protein [Anaerolineae bacterium]NIQ82715.1 peptide ABC transporter substrate-binding protein [Anaerolineae bacterium]